MSYIYIQSQHDVEEPLWTVGFYTPDGEWEPESDHRTARSAAARVIELNGAA